MIPRKQNKTRVELEQYYETLALEVGQGCYQRDKPNKTTKDAPSRTRTAVWPLATAHNDPYTNGAAPRLNCKAECHKNRSVKWDANEMEIIREQSAAGM